jgi:hypothetical protein
MSDDKVDHPSHYGGDTVYETIKVAKAWGYMKDAQKFEMLRYLSRSGTRVYDGLTPLQSEIRDLEKLIWYAQDKIKDLKNEP